MAFPLTYHRITNSDFRLCSTRQSRSQARFLRLHSLAWFPSKLSEPLNASATFLGGDRPSQTAHLTMSPASIQRRRLEFQCRKDGIPTSAPESPKRLFPSVPSILCMQHRNPISGYSKAPWGLSVLSRVTGIFTGTTISPGGLLRQCPDHYAFHAGQNLPDKEFRYLRNRYSYGRRSLGLQFNACTSPFNLPAPGRRQLVYVIFRFSTNLCFW